MAVDIFQLKEKHVEVTHELVVGGTTLGTTVSAISYPTFLNIIEQNAGADLSNNNPIELYIAMLEAFGVTNLVLPKHLVKMEYSENRGVMLYQLYGGPQQKVFSEINADTSRIVVSFFMDTTKTINSNSINVYRYTGIFAGELNQAHLVPLESLTMAFRAILGESHTCTTFEAANMHELIKRLPSRGGVTQEVRQVVNAAKNTNTEIRWENLT